MAFMELFLLWLNLRKVRLDWSADLSPCSSKGMLLTVFSMELYLRTFRYWTKVLLIVFAPD
jgi:hypothetical protein